MAYKDISLRDLMDAARKQRGDSEPDLDIPELDDIFFGEAEEPPIQLPDIDTCIAQVLTQLEQYTPDEKAQKVIREFLTFRLRVRQQPVPEAHKTFYNLLLICEEADTSIQAAKVIQEALGIRDVHINKLPEKQAIQLFDKGNTALLTPAYTQLLLIYDCKEGPRFNTDGGATARDKSMREIELYNNFWRHICEYAKSHPETIVIVSGNPIAYRNSLRPNNELSIRVCSHHATLHEPSTERLIQRCLDAFRSSSFTISEDFEKALTEYFPASYRASDLTGQSFIDDLIRRVYARYFCQKREDNTLTPDCVPDDNPKFQSVEAVLNQMDELVGLQEAKEEFGNIYKMQLAGLSEGTGHYHMLFEGNPGTGKTTVAKMAADLLYTMNVIKRNKVVCVKPSDMVSEWVGGTGTKAMEVIRRAYNGVLFIDEAYGIASMDRGNELLNILIQEMENNSDRLVVILAGYTDEMRELLKANPGLASRIGRRIHFEDYNLEELAQIFLLMCQKEGFTLHPDARDELEDCIGNLMSKEFFSNARDIRNMLQALKEAWSEEYYRVVQEKGEENATLERQFCAHHFERILPPKKEISIRDLIGLDTMKKKLEAFKQQAMYQRYLQEKGITGLSNFSMHMIFTGNPGTGKTTVAKLIADDLYSIGMLKSNRLVVAERKDLISYYGDTSKKTADIVNKATGGVLFIDEAYSLADKQRGGLGNECIEVLLTAMEEHKSDTVFIFAGYVDEMQEFLAANPGIQSRIGYTFHFDDYTADELTRMFAQKLRKTGFTISAGALKKTRKIMEYFQDVRNFGNGRFVDHVIHQTISRRAKRDFTKQYRDIESRDIPDIQEIIETAPNSMHLYDPAEISQEQLKRIAIHEMGHAVVLTDTDPERLPKTVSIRNHAGSFGRVTPASGLLSYTEEQLLHHIASLLGGLNAEKVFYGNHSTGCSSDYDRAKTNAANMIERYAMTTYGTTPEEILKAADTLANDLVRKYKPAMEKILDRLLEEKELSGEEFAKALKESQQA